MQVQQTATALPSGALTFFSDGVTTVTAIKNTKGTIYLLDLMNGTAATAYLQVFFRKASEVTLGTTAPDFTIVLPTNAGAGFTKTINFPAPIGGERLDGINGSGLCVAGTTAAGGASAASIKVSAVYA